MQTPEHQSDNLEARITAALEQAPQIHIPADFASRVAAQAPARSTLRVTRSPRIGRTTLFAAMAILAAIMLALIPQTLTGAPTARLLEYTFTFEFFALVLYTTLRPEALR